MIVYRQPTRTVRAAEVLDLAVFHSHEEIRSFLIHFGELEAALADEGCSKQMQEQLRDVSLTAGMLFCSPDTTTADRLRELLNALPLPEHPITVSVPEGYAYYSLFPETYAESAVKLFIAKRPTQVVCIGIRSIGTSLSAVVSAKLQLLGCSVRSWTVRPGGHPFDRQLSVSSEIENIWKESSNATFAIVDEGPGLSGSSFASVAEKLSELGISDDRICFLPSWNPSGEAFRSETAKRRWLRHEKYTSDPPPLCGTDISAGKWRAAVYADQHDYPAVQAQHEASKFLSSTQSGPVLRKFAGLGTYGYTKLHRARELANAGFSVPVGNLENGYLVSNFVPGKPLQASAVDHELLDTMARYLAFRRAAFQRDDATPITELCGMMEFNSGVQTAPVVPDPPCLVDGRMLPHEWLATSAGYIKTDALDHGDNHFYPGPTDMAWDVAGAIVEFRMQEGERDYLLDAYTQCGRDWTIRERLPFYTAAYLAFRLGYTTMNGFNKEASFYRSMLSERMYVKQ